MTDPSADPAEHSAAASRRSTPDDLPPGAISRALRALGMSDDAPPLVRGSRAWWWRSGVFAAGLLVMIALVYLGG